MDKLELLINWWIHLSFSQALLCGLLVFIVVVLISLVVDFLLWMRSDES